LPDDYATGETSGGRPDPRNNFAAWHVGCMAETLASWLLM
jgi:hypothetical protein